MFDLNFISNPGLQSEKSNASWSYEIEENTKSDQKLDVNESGVQYRKSNTWKYLITLFIIIICFIVVDKFTSTAVKPNIVLNNIIDIIVESEHNMNLQLVEINFLSDKVEVLIRSEKTKDMQFVLDEYYLQKHFLYDLYQKGVYNYISINFPWEINVINQDISNLSNFIKKTRFSDFIVYSNDKEVIEIHGKSTDIISFLLYMTEANQIKNYYYSIFYNEYDNFKLKILLNII